MEREWACWGENGVWIREENGRAEYEGKKGCVEMGRKRALEMRRKRVCGSRKRGCGDEEKRSTWKWLEDGRMELRGNRAYGSEQKMGVWS